MWNNKLKTTILLASLSGLLMLFGGLLGGYDGVIIAFVMSLVINGLAYFFSDKLVLKLYRAQPLNSSEHPEIYKMVKELTEKDKLPMPKLWIIKNKMANAFATGRNPNNSSVALTTGIMEILNLEELRGVIAHEISHIKNRDILIGTIAATIAASIGLLANLVQNLAFWSTVSGDNRQRGPNPIILLLLALIMPIAATLIQLAISRSREYLADETGADLSEDPLALASALEKIHKNVQTEHFANYDAAKSATAHLFIIKPFTQGGFTSLFSTHPPVAERVARLKKMHVSIKKSF